MILGDLLDNNNELVRTCLELIEASVKERDIEAMVEEAIKTMEPQELTKGMFITVRNLMFAMRRSYEFSTLCNFLYSDLEELSRLGRDVTLDYKIINLLTLMDGEGGSFYLQVHSLNSPVQAVTILIKMFKRMSFLFFQEDAEHDTLKTVPHLIEELNKLRDEKASRQKEQARLTAVMRAEKLAVEEALHLTKVLAPHFITDISETGARIPRLAEKAFQVDEVRNAINVPHQVELLKGICLLTAVFLSKYLMEAGTSILPIIEHRRKEVEAESFEYGVEADDIVIQLDAMDLMERTAKLDEEGFYQKAYSVDDVEGVILSLSTSLYRTVRYAANDTIDNFVTVFQDLLK
jgi:hypothetical protein